MGEARRRQRSKRWDMVSLNDFDIPINEFCAIFDLTENEVQNEFAAGRLSLRGIPADNGYRNVTIRESRAQAWITKEELPIAVQSKIDAAGGLRALDVWRETWIDRSIIDFENSKITLPDGTVFADVQMRKSDIDRLIRLSRN
jgi:hypothetical protein